jgi:hypothetical protein
MRTLARVRDKAELADRLRRVRADSLRRWGRMSPHQMVCHVADALCLMTEQKIADPGASLVERTVLKWLVLYMPLPWPTGILTSPELDPERGGTRPVDFAADLARVEAMLEAVTAVPAHELERLRHPVFGRMSRAAWLRWAYLHTDHHLRQFGA